MVFIFMQYFCCHVGEILNLIQFKKARLYLAIRITHRSSTVIFYRQLSVTELFTLRPLFQNRLRDLDLLIKIWYTDEQLVFWPDPLRFIYAFSSKCAKMTVMWAFSDLHL